MKRTFLLLSLAILAVSICSQASADTNENLSLSRDAETGAFALSWDGKEDRTYFILYTGVLGESWHYLPIIEQGNDEPIIYGFWISGGANRSFFHLRHTDQPAPDPYTAVFGGDGIPSGWKLENGLDPFADYTGLSPDGSSLTYWELYQLSLEGGSDPADANVAGLIVYTP